MHILSNKRYNKFMADKADSDDAISSYQKELTRLNSNYTKRGDYIISLQKKNKGNRISLNTLAQTVTDMDTEIDILKKERSVLRRKLTIAQKNDMPRDEKTGRFKKKASK